MGLLYTHRQILIISHGFHKKGLNVLLPRVSLNFTGISMLVQLLFINFMLVPGL